MKIMKKQYPWITVISAIALLLITFYLLELNLFLIGLGCLAAVFIGEGIGCIRANKTGKTFAPNIGALISSGMLMLPVIIGLIYDTAVNSHWKIVTFLALIIFGTATGVSLVANLLNFLYKKHKLKQERINAEYPQHARPPRIQIKPLVPWIIALAAVMVLQIIINEMMFEYHVEDVLMVVMSTANWLLTAQLLGLIFNQVLGLSFVNYIIMLGWLVYSIGETFRLIEFYSESTGFNASYVEWMISLCIGQLIAYSVLAAVVMGILIAAVVKQFKKPKWRKKHEN